jgi:predicted nucleic acid-binding protein
MLYYYYSNKNSLFEEIVINEFIALTERLNSAVPRGLPLEETYFTAVKQRKELNNYDKAVYKLAMKVWLGFEGSSEIRRKLIAWEEGRHERNRKILSRICSQEEKLYILTEVVVGIFQNLTERIILFNEDIPDDKIRKEIAFVLRCTSPENA